jgi:hypothetical protein
MATCPNGPAADPDAPLPPAPARDVIGQLDGSCDVHHDAKPRQPCRRLIASGCLSARGGQPAQILLHLTLDQLRGLPGASAAEAAWAGRVAGPGADCDATIIPVVTGHIDPVLLDHLAITLLHAAHPADAGPARDRALCAARQMILAAAADLLSGPGGLAAYLRTGVAGGLSASVSLPLDVGAATETIPRPSAPRGRWRRS